MKKIGKKISVLLALTVLMTSLNLEVVYANDDEKESGAEVVAEEVLENDTTAGSESKPIEADIAEQEKPEEIEASDEYIESSNHEDVEEKSDIVLNYIYVESPYLETPQKQNIVLSLETGESEISDMVLQLKKEDGTIEEWPAELQKDQLYLFSHDFEDTTLFDSYTVAGYKFLCNGEKKEESLDSELVKASFGVNKVVEESSDIESYMLDKGADQASDDLIVETNLITDENEIIAKDENIGDALRALGIDSDTNESASFMSRRKDNNYVIAIDAGHDRLDAGAHANGLAEEALTLKIANYCKQELEKYSGVTVYMTRTSADCPVGVRDEKHAGPCIKERVKRAADAGADFFVSLHLNSSIYSNASGAEVIIPNASWKPEHASQGKALAEKIMNELVGLGLKRREIYHKDTTKNEKYDDGSKADYFSVQYWGKKYNVPGIIVEHAFLSNNGAIDANLLKSEAGLKALGVADAKGIADYLGLKTGEWKVVDGKTYYYENGKKVFGEKAIAGAWYYFDEKTGVMATGWTKHHGNQYYYNSKGQMIHGETVIGDSWYYFDEITGVMATGWTKHHNKQYYYDSQGRMVKGQRNISGSTYYFDDITGVMFQAKLDSKNNYYGPDGKLMSNLTLVEGKSDQSIVAKMVAMYYSKSPIEYPAWALSKGGADTIEAFAQICYEEATSEKIKPELIFAQAMLETGWLRFGGDVKIEQFNFAGLGATGNGVRGQDFSKYRENGVRMGLRAQVQHMKAYAIKNVKKEQLSHACVDERFDYVAKGSSPYIEWLGIQENPYRKGWASGKNYGFNLIKVMKELSAQNSTLKNGLVVENGKTYYYINGRKVRSQEIQVNGSWKWFDTDGVMAVSKDVFLPTKKIWVRYDKNGNMVKGWDKTSNGTYYFDLSTGEMYKGVHNIDGKYYYFAGTTGKKVEEKRKEVVLDGAWRWFDADGTVAVSKDVFLPTGKKWVRYNAKAEMVKGWDKTSSGTYYFDTITGEMYKGVNKISGKYYYFLETTGVKVEERLKEVVLDGAWRWFDADGTVAVSKDVFLPTGKKWVRYNKKAEMIKGWDKTSAGTYYFDLITGEMLKGRHNIGGKSYYFNIITGILEN